MYITCKCLKIKSICEIRILNSQISQVPSFLSALKRFLEELIPFHMVLELLEGGSLLCDCFHWSIKFSSCSLFNFCSWWFAHIIDFWVDSLEKIHLAFALLASKDSFCNTDLVFFFFPFMFFDLVNGWSDLKHYCWSFRPLFSTSYWSTWCTFSSNGFKRTNLSSLVKSHENGSKSQK